MIRNRLHIIFALAFAMVVASSCAHREKNEPEPGVSSKNPYSDKVTFVIGNAASVSPETRSAVSFGSSRRFIGVQGDDSLFITSSVSRINIIFHLTLYFWNSIFVFCFVYVIS